MAFDVSKLSTADKVIAGSGVGILIASFLPWLGIDGIKETGSGWDAPFGAPVMFAVLFALAAAAWVVARASGVQVQLPLGPALLTLALAGLALFFVVYQVLLDWPDAGGLVQIDFERKIGAWLALLLSIAQTVFAVMTFRESGEEIPGVQTGGGTPPPAPPA